MPKKELSRADVRMFTMLAMPGIIIIYVVFKNEPIFGFGTVAAFLAILGLGAFLRKRGRDKVAKMVADVDESD